MYAARLISSLIDHATPMQEFFKLSVDATLFMNQERQLIDYMISHISQYGTFPTREALADATQVGHITIPIPLPEQATESPQYYYDKSTQQFLHNQIRATALEIQDALGEQDVTGALKIMAKASIDLSAKSNKNALVNFSQEGFDIVLKEYKKKQVLGNSYGLTTGWPTLDGMCAGGLIGGDVLSIIGRPEMGKTYKMLFIAIHCWIHGKVPLIISLEMKPLPIMQRLAGMLSQLPVHHIKDVLLTPGHGLPQLMKVLEELRERHPFWIVDGALNSSVSDILMTTKQLKPDVVFIDSAYLLKHPNPKMARWERMTENAEAVKRDLAEGCDIPVVQTYQFNKKATEKKDGAPGGLENIAYTDAIGQLSSLVLAITEKSSVETMRQRRIDVIKGRDGQSGGFDINWLFEFPNPMDFSEIKHQGVEDLQFM